MNVRDFNAHGLLAEDPIRQMLDHTLLPFKYTVTAKALHCLGGSWSQQTTMVEVVKEITHQGGSKSVTGTK